MVKSDKYVCKDNTFFCFFRLQENQDDVRKDKKVSFFLVEDGLFGIFP